MSKKQAVEEAIKKLETRSIFNKEQTEFLKRLSYLSDGELLDILLGHKKLNKYLEKGDLKEFNSL